MKILSPYQNWDNIKEELKKVSFLVKDISVQYFKTITPRELYMKDNTFPEGRYGIARVFLSNLMKDVQEDITILHAPYFEIEGAGGWFSHINGKPFIQFYGSHLKEYSKTGEFKYWVSEVIVHELCHKYYRKFGLTDRTHYWHYEEKRLLGAVEDIQKHLLREKIGLLEQVEILLRKLLSRKHQEEVVKEKEVKESRLEKWALAIQEMEGWFEGSLTWRHNNPGALRWSRFETDNKNNFSVFPDYETGFKALLYQLEIAITGKSKVYYPEMTLLQFFERYAPSSDNNNPRKYSQFVAGKLGVSIDTKIKTLG